MLNVAEKPSVAKEISRVLSNGQARARDGLTPWNKVWGVSLRRSRSAGEHGVHVGDGAPE